MVVYPLTDDATMIHSLAERLSDDLTNMARIARQYGVANATTDKLLAAEETLEFIVEHVETHVPIRLQGAHVGHDASRPDLTQGSI
jgi:hypothetical protein